MVGLQYFGSRISANISRREPEGYLYCLNVPIARTGVQKYLASEIGLDGSSVVEVHRTEDEVFNPAAMASFEGMPVTRDHPPEEVDVQNIGAYQRGHVQNVRRGSGAEKDCLMADFVVTHIDLIHDILDNKVRDVSCGYEVEYKEDDNGRVYQAGIRGNHVAIVDSGRAGERVSIRDAAFENGAAGTDRKGIGGHTMAKKGSIWARMFTSFARDSAVAPEEVIEAADEIFNEAEVQKEQEKPAVDRKACGKDEMTAPFPEMTKKEDPMAAKDEGEDELLRLVSELASEVKSLKEMVLSKPASAAQDEDEDEDIIIPAKEEAKPDETSLDALEKEMSEEPMEPLQEDEDEDEPFDTPLNEGSVTVKPEDIETDEDFPAEVEGEKGPDEKTREAVVSAINDLKPIIAGLPAKDRKRAADAASRALRRVAGMEPVPSKGAKDKLASVAGRKKVVQAKDSQMDERKLGQDIMRKRNPHYKA